MLDDPMFLRQIIMDHYEHPRNKRQEPTYEHIRMSTNSCIDDLDIQVLFQDNILADLCFDGEACTIATASTSIMTELLKGKTIAEAQELLTAYQDMIALKEYNAELLHEAVAFQNVGKQTSRIRCATLGWLGVEALIKRLEGNQDV